MLLINIINLSFLTMFLILITFIKEIDTNDNICEILDKSFEFLNKYNKLYAKEFDSKHDDGRGINQMEKTEFFNVNFTMLAIHKQLSKLGSNIIQLDFDATSLYPSAMWDKNSVYSKKKKDLLLNHL